jgi:hypothetical protein
MFIEVKKISVVQKRAFDGSKVRNPLDKSNPQVTEEIKIVRECIRVDEIKSFRPWNKSVEEEISIEGKVTMVYLIGDKTKKAAELKVNESYDSFKVRLNALNLREEQVSE